MRGQDMYDQPRDGNDFRFDCARGEAAAAKEDPAYLEVLLHDKVRVLRKDCFRWRKPQAVVRRPDCAARSRDALDTWPGRSIGGTAALALVPRLQVAYCPVALVACTRLAFQWPRGDTESVYASRGMPLSRAVFSLAGILISGIFFSALHTTAHATPLSGTIQGNV